MERVRGTGFLFFFSLTEMAGQQCFQSHRNSLPLRFIPDRDLSPYLSTFPPRVLLFFFPLFFLFICFCFPAGKLEFFVAAGEPAEIGEI